MSSGKILVFHFVSIKIHNIITFFFLWLHFVINSFEILFLIGYLGVIALPGSAISALIALPGRAITKRNKKIYAKTTAPNVSYFVTNNIHLQVT